MIKIITSGESHSEAIYGIVDGFPKGLFVDVEGVNAVLKKRMQGLGRGKRMSIENDKIIFASGLENNITTGNPLTLIINNKASDIKNKQVVARPGHADYVGSIKYKNDNIRSVIERASARKTAMDVAIGALFEQLLTKINVSVDIADVCIKGVSINNKNIKGVIEDAKAKNTSLGGSFTLSINGLVPGVGSYTLDENKLDGILSQTLMSTNSIKGVINGDAILGSNSYGYDYLDEFKNSSLFNNRKSNNQGGIEAGISNGMPILFTCYVKPIPNQTKPLNGLNINTLKVEESFNERADICAVESVSIVAKYKIITTLSKVLLLDHLSYTLDDFVESYNNYIKNRKG